MDGQNLEKPAGQPVGELEPMRPEELLGNIADIGRSFRDYALKLQIMLEVAKEREIPVDLSGNQTLKDFEVPDGKEENKLRRIQQKLTSVRTGTH